MASPDSFVSKEKIEKILALDFQDDVLISGFPRTGTTWLQELIWIIQHDGDLEQASRIQVGCRVPFLESRGYDWEHSVDDLDQHPHPRVMKTHLTPAMYRNKLDCLKMIISIRNPKDTVVSMYNYFKLWKDMPFQMSLDQLVDVFVGDQPFNSGGPAFDYFSWYMEAVPLLDHPKVKLIKYEDQKKDLKAGIRDIAVFLDKRFDDHTIDAIATHCQFENLKRNEMVNQTTKEIYDQTKGNFFHKGQKGTWRDVLTTEQSQKIDRKYEETLKKAGIELDFG